MIFWLSRLAVVVVLALLFGPWGILAGVCSILVDEGLREGL